MLLTVLLRYIIISTSWDITFLGLCPLSSLPLALVRGGLHCTMTPAERRRRWFGFQAVSLLQQQFLCSTDPLCCLKGKLIFLAESSYLRHKAITSAMHPVTLLAMTILYLGFLPRDRCWPGAHLGVPASGRRPASGTNLISTML